MIGGSRPRPVEALRSAATAREQLEWEGVYDRRWHRHRDQLVTTAGIVVAAGGAVAGHWLLLPVGVGAAVGPAVRDAWQARRDP
jgi:hypothetical protein